MSSFLFKMQTSTNFRIFVLLLVLGASVIPGLESGFAQSNSSQPPANSDPSSPGPQEDGPGVGPAQNPDDSSDPANSEFPQDGKEIKKYNDQFKRGLLSVFQAEANHNIKKLSRHGLTNPIPRVRAAAAFALGRLGSKAGVKTLHKMIDHDGETVRQAAYFGLADIGARASLEYFYAGAKSSDKEIRVSSFRGMGKTADPSAREVLLRKGITSDDKDIVKASILGLGYYQAPEDIRIFIDYLNSPDEELQKAAVEALGRHKTRTSMNILEDAFRDKGNLRAQILDTLTAQKNSFAVFALLRILNNFPDSDVIAKEIGVRLYKLKVSGKFMTVTSEKVPLLKEPFVGSPTLRDLDGGEVGKVLQKSPKRYILDINGQRIENFYYKVLVNTKFKDAFTETATGWVFGSYIKIRTVSLPKSSKKKKRPSILDEEDPAPNPQTQPTPPGEEGGTPATDGP
ncbi:HEAT repeat protein [Leptospira inadai serovar Lyme str. 10]|uniref:HEAT repeat protein n=2 Tax=Leptospira inadai serovar Lyme TaxID=293084 RepID=V6HH69_9LEPT|nr:HEAT repeat domain-containing protein [Leptospira inadai]EQA35530.1 HEAT repeat protein [Leptospira inadai serovar Lyme str. 10]PNV75879.1 HEAT repeat domain-containing protein [Leptospira inadai serovar Lyme]